MLKLKTHCNKHIFNYDKNDAVIYGTISKNAIGLYGKYGMEAFTNIDGKEVLVSQYKSTFKSLHDVLVTIQSL
jgi:hypothetical protein